MPEYQKTPDEYFACQKLPSRDASGARGWRLFRCVLVFLFWRSSFTPGSLNRTVFRQLCVQCFPDGCVRRRSGFLDAPYSFLSAVPAVLD